MKSAKILGLVAITAIAVAATACVGVPSASATVFCKNKVSPCTSQYGTSTNYSASLAPGTELTIAVGFGTVKCTGSSMSLDQSSSGGGGGTPVSVLETSLSFSGCNASLNTYSLGNGSVSWTYGTNGDYVGLGSGVEIQAGTTRCYYGGAILSGFTLTGGAPASVSLTNVETVRQAGSSALCANPAKWNANYKLSGTSADLWITSS
jgi:hypothetical protein